MIVNTSYVTNIITMHDETAVPKKITLQFAMTSGEKYTIVMDSAAHPDQVFERAFRKENPDVKGGDTDGYITEFISFDCKKKKPADTQTLYHMLNTANHHIVTLVDRIREADQQGLFETGALADAADDAFTFVSELVLDPAEQVD